MKKLGRFLERTFVDPDTNKVSLTAIGVIIGMWLVVDTYVAIRYGGFVTNEAFLKFVEGVAAILVIGTVGRYGFGRVSNAMVGFARNRNRAPAANTGEQVQPKQQTTPDGAPIFTMPCDGRITSGFRTIKRPTHHGIDIAATGDVPIMAAAAGVVVKSYLSTSYGECIILEHDFDGDLWHTLYAHMRPGTRIELGVAVDVGEVIGVMGNTGRSHGQHLHFEMHHGRWMADKSNAVDPLKYLQ